MHEPRTCKSISKMPLLVFTGIVAFNPPDTVLEFPPAPVVLLPPVAKVEFAAIPENAF